jgi:hypothetical protein
MFFLGLLSTPIPYLLLAAFYFFGFAMGMFNNKIDDEVAEPVVSVTIPAEVKENKTEQTVYYFHVNREPKTQTQPGLKFECNFAEFAPDTGPTLLICYSVGAYDFNYSNSLFCRPPPVLC